MESTECSCCGKPEVIAPALLRWAVGLHFLVAGIGKIPRLGGFVRGYLVPAFEKTFLPSGLVAAYGYALPFVEALLGIMLILGICRNFALSLAGLTLLSLAFGQMLLQNPDKVASIFIHVLMVAAALYMSREDRFSLDSIRNRAAGD